MEAQAVALALEEPSPSAAETLVVPESDIATLAYRLWQERGCPIGSPEEDWYRAEERLTAGTEEAHQ
jgi:Protein of unknown function (DUF2934)